MRILFTNDDGIDAAGINILAEAFCNDNEVFMVAPKANCSAFSHSLTVGKDLFYEVRAPKSNITAYSTSGTPADCVKFAILNLMNDCPPDIVISGINNGPNLGPDIMYSGTVAAACEAAYLGIPSIAVSLNEKNREDICYLRAAEFVKRNLKEIIRLNQSFNTILNINYPANGSQGAVITRADTSPLPHLYAISNESGGYRLKGKQAASDISENDCDIIWSKKGYATITPLKLDRNDYKTLEILKNGMVLK